MPTEQERADRNVLYAAGYHYAAKKPGLTVAQQKAFGNAYADKYAAAGLSPAQAWKDLRSRSG